jgi:hypothetical protein
VGFIGLIYFSGKLPRRTIGLRTNERYVNTQIRLWLLIFLLVENSEEVHPHKDVSLGRGVAQAVSRRPPTAAARVDHRSGHVGFVGDKVALGQVFY